MFRLAIKAVKHNPRRLILTAIAIALGVALISATHIFTNALESGFNQQVQNESSDIGAYVLPADENGDATALTAELLAELNDLPEVATAGGTLQVFGSLIDADGKALGDLMTGTPHIFMNWNGAESIDKVRLVSGAAPEQPGEFVLDSSSAEKYGFAVGDEVTIASSGAKPFQLVGLVEFADGSPTAGITSGYLLLPDLIDLGKITAEFPLFEVIGAIGVSDQELKAAVVDVVPAGLEVLDAEEMLARDAAAFKSAMNSVDIFTLAFALISMFVGGYLIANTFRIIVTQRTRELGLLRAIGVSGKQVRKMVLLEALVIAVISSIIGILIGYLFAAAIVGLMSLTGSGDIFGTLVIPLDAILWGLAVGLLVTMSSALLPAIHASRISPMEALRDSATQARRGIRYRNLVGGALALAGVAAITLGLTVSPPRPYLYVAVGAVLVILGVGLLGAWLLRPTVAALRPVLQTLFRVDGKLAANNILREPRRSSNTAAALMIGVMLLSLTATLTASIKAMVTDQLASDNKSDLLLTALMPTMYDPELEQVVADIPGVEVVTAITNTYLSADGSAGIVVGLDPARIDQAFNFDTTPALTELGDGVFINPTIQETGVDVGDEITIDGPSASLTLTVTGLFHTSGSGDYLVSLDTSHQLDENTLLGNYFVTFTPDADVAEVTEAVRETIAATHPMILVVSPADLTELVNVLMDLILGVITALLSAALIIAVLGVTNTLFLAVTERTREIGLLRAVGARRKSVKRIIRLEAIVLSLFGAVLGMILGVTLGLAIIKALAEFGLSSPAVPWGWLMLYTVLAVIAGLLAAWLPARRAAKLDILEAIATD